MSADKLGGLGGRLAGRRAVVVGVGSDIGRACATTFAREGARLVVVDPDEDVVRQLAASVSGAGGEAHAETAGFADEQGAGRVADLCASLWGCLDVLVDCGTAMDAWRIEDDSLDRWEGLFRVNVLGPLAYTNALRNLLTASDAGSVVYLSSVDGLLGNPAVPAYSVTKGGLIPLTHVMAHDFAPSGVRVNCIATAAIPQTAPTAPPVPRPSPSLEVLKAVTPLGRPARAEDIAGVALFLASDDAAFVTGAVIPVDGGRLAVTRGTG